MTFFDRGIGQANAKKLIKFFANFYDKKIRMNEEIEAIK
jgi:hypothetical protein